jgi:signal transduction histidine kinase/DNA-binding response OmpR family regulator
MNLCDELRVLLIEDDEDDYILIKSLLSHAAFGRVELDWASSYQGGLDALQNIRYDACLLDYALGDRTGIELLCEAGRTGSQAAMILLTGHCGDSIDLEALAAGAVDYLVKGEINARTLQRSIRYAVERNKDELELKRYRDRLEELVEQRTSELRDSNLRLRMQMDERMEADLALRLSEERIAQQNCFLRSVIDSLSHPFYVIDPEDHSVVLANSAAMPGDLEPDAAYCLLLHEGRRPCDCDGHQCAVGEIQKSKKPLIAEHVKYNGKGAPRYVEVHCYPILDAKGDVSKIIEYCLDVTERKEIEEKLRRTQENLELRVRERTEKLADANLAFMNQIIARSKVETALRLNEKRLEALLNLSQTACKSERQIADYVLEQDIKLSRSQVGAIGFLDKNEKIITWRTGAARDLDLECPGIRTENAGTWADAVRRRKPVISNDISSDPAYAEGLPFPNVELRRLISVPVLNEERVVAVAVLANKQDDYDQSDLRQLTLLLDGMWKLIERERSAKALKDSENLAAIGRALSCVAHDMKTPLVAIGGFVKQVQRHIEETDPDWDKMKIVLCETERLEKLVEDMLDFSKPLELRKSRENIDAILEESVAVTRLLADKKKVSLLVEALGSPPDPVPLDRLRIKRVFINLLANAIEASPEGEKVTVSYRRRAADLVVDVTDMGPGIAVEIRNEIFLPFFTTRRDGTGLGLPIVKKIVEAHGGSLMVLDTQRGATFRLRLPSQEQSTNA